MSQELQRFGVKLRVLRKHRQVTLIELAHVLGYASHSYVGEVERGEKIPTVEFVLKVSRYFGVPADQLIKDELDVQVDKVE